MSRPKQLKQIEFEAFDHIEQESDTISAEESYALYLKDIKCLHQQACADQMGISRANFQQILDSAHTKVAIAVLNKSTLSISGGDFVTSSCQLKCQNCNHHYIPTLVKHKTTCPNCGLQEISCTGMSEKCVNVGCKRVKNNL
jgi:predicted DNA-binding protein (UPF0251 family)